MKTNQRDMNIYEKQMLQFIDDSGIINQNKVYSAEDLKTFLSTVVKTTLSVMKIEENMVSLLSSLGREIKSVSSDSNETPVANVIKKRGRPRKVVVDTVASTTQKQSSEQLDLFANRKESRPQDDCTTKPRMGRRCKVIKTTGYTQDHSLTMPKVNQIRISKANGYIRPMVVDYDLAHSLYMDDFTHVQIVSNMSNPNKKSLLFSKETVKTRAPKKNHTVSRLNIYGYSKNEVSTYAISTQNFQKTIAKAFDIDLDKLPNNSQVIIQLSDVKNTSNGKKLVTLEKLVAIK
jgi:hypothetical protein